VTLHVVPVELAEANAFIAAHHRHHQPVIGHRFSIGCIDDTGALHGVCVIGRPVARLAGSPRDVLEVTRVATDGTRNACSILYAAAARAGKALGFKRIQTYTLPVEGGASLRATGWKSEGDAGGGQWKHTDGKPRRTDQPIDVKTRWALALGERPDMTPLALTTDAQPDLFGESA
jgi:hypothetical protein